MNEPRIIKCPYSGLAYNFNVVAERLGLNKPDKKVTKQKELKFKN